MHFQQELRFLSTFIFLAQSSPVLKRQSKEAFTVPQVAAKPFIASGPAVIASVYGKYNVQAPQDVAAAAASNNSTVTASPEQYDSEYLCAVEIGGQTLNLDFDTGSADLWVFSSELSAADQTGHRIYDPSKSQTSNKLKGETWKISYGDQSSASGDVYADTVQIGQTTATSQAVELAQTVSAQFLQDTNNDGLVGLAFDNINTVTPDAQKTFFTNVKSNLDSPVFTADLKKGAPGSYDFGYIDATKHTGSITYATVDTKNSFWEFTSSGYKVGSAAFQSQSIDAIADTGTSLLLLETAIVTAYYKGTGATYDSSQGGYTFPCTTTLPDLTLGIGSYKAVIPGSYINYAPTDNTGTTCFGGVQRNTGLTFSIFGDVFLKSQFVVFDGSDTPRVGFAPKPTS